MTAEEEFEVLRQHGWRWRQIDDELFEIETPERYAGKKFCFGAMLSEALVLHSPLVCDLAEEARGNLSSWAAYLYDYHVRHNLSQAELAEHLGCAVDCIRDFASKNVPSKDALDAEFDEIARATGCSTKALRRVIDEQKRPPQAWLTEGGEP